MLGLTRVARIDYPASGAPSRPRFADSLISDQLSNLTHTGMILPPGPDISDALLESNVIVIGATKFSKSANWIQQQFDLHYQHVIDYQSDGQEITRVVSGYGEEYTASQDLGLSVDGLMVGYGTFLTYCSDRGRNLCWIAGTHGNASLGVCYHLMKNPNAFQAFQSISEHEGLIWLVRIFYNPDGESFEAIKKMEVVEKPFPVRKREIIPKPKALIVDLGKVLFQFDCQKLFYEFAAQSDMSPDEIRAALYETESFTAYQKGNLSSKEFYKAACYAAHLEIDYDEFARVWASIFTLNISMRNALIKLSEQTQLIMLSNSNELHWNYLESTYAEVFNLFEGRVFSSHQIRASKPDPKAFHEAVSSAGEGVYLSDCLFVDDCADHVSAAEKLGIPSHRYIRPSGFAYWIRENGLYIP